MKCNIWVSTIPKPVDQLFPKIFDFGGEPESLIHCPAAEHLDGTSKTIISKARISTGKFENLMLL